MTPLGIKASRRHFAGCAIIIVAIFVFGISTAFAERMSVDDFKKVAFGDPEKYTVLVMNFSDYSGDLTLRGLAVAAPNEIARQIRSRTKLNVKRVVELENNQSRPEDQTELSLGTFSLKFNPKQIKGWLKKRKLAMVIEGDYAQIGRELRLTARMIDPKKEEQVGSDIQVRGDVIQAPLLLDQLTEKIVMAWPWTIRRSDIKDDANSSSWGQGSTARQPPQPTAAASPITITQSDLRGVSAKNFDVSKIFGGSRSDKSINVKVTMDKSKYKIGDMARISAKSNVDGYLTLIDIATSGNVHVIFPNHWQTNNFVRAGQKIAVPDTGESDYIIVDGPAGTTKVLAVITREPSALTLPDLSQGLGRVTYRDLKIMPKTLNSTSYNYSITEFDITP
jgi:TolB-like protein